MTFDEYKEEYPDAVELTLEDINDSHNVFGVKRITLKFYVETRIENLFDKLEISKNDNVQFSACFFTSSFSEILEKLEGIKNITFRQCYFEDLPINTGTFGDIFFLQCDIDHLYLSGGAFDDISLDRCCLSHLSLIDGKFKSFNIYMNSAEALRIGIFNQIECLGNISIEHASIEQIYLSGNNKNNIYFLRDLEVIRDIQFSNFTNEGSVKLVNTKMLDGASLYIKDSNLGKSEFYNVTGKNMGTFYSINSYIADCLFINFSWNFRFDEHPKHGEQKRDLFRQLRQSMLKHNDKISEAKFYALEMDEYAKTLTKKHWDYWIIKLSRWTSDYGQSVKKPLISILGGHSFLFMIALIFGGFEDIQFSLSAHPFAGFSLGLEKFVQYINPIRTYQYSLHGGWVLIDLAMRTWSSYMIYNLIRATRKFISQ